MILINSGFLKSVILLFFLLFCSAAYTQTEKQEPQNRFKVDTLKKYNLLQTMPDFNLNSFSYLKSFGSLNFFMKNFKTFQPLQKRRYTDWLFFSQTKTESVSTGLGGYQHFKNQLTVRKNKFTLEVEAGLASQNTLLMTSPVYQVSFGTLVKYNVTDWLDAYLYGQYVTKPLNRPKDFFDPFLYSNPLFIQTEVGGGVRTNFKKVNANLKVFSIYQEESKTFSPMNSVIRIEF